MQQSFSVERTSLHRFLGYCKDLSVQEGMSCCYWLLYRYLENTQTPSPTSHVKAIVHHGRCVPPFKPSINQACQSTIPASKPPSKKPSKEPQKAASQSAPVSSQQMAKS